MESTETRASSASVLSWSLGLSLILYGSYKVLFKATPFARLLAVTSTGENTKPLDPAEKARAGITRISFKREYLLEPADGTRSGRQTTYSLSPLPSVEFPEALSKGLDQPQLMAMRTGIISIYVTDIAPSSLASKRTLTILTLLYALVTVLCIQPMASLLGAANSLGESLVFTIIFYSFALLFIALSILAAALIVVNLLKLDVAAVMANNRHFGRKALIALLWNALIFVPLIRSFILSYETLYAFTIWRLMAALLVGLVISAVVCPLIFVPSLYLLLRLEKVLEVFL